jgi:hypothetical protein
MFKYSVKYLKLFNEDCIRPFSDASFQERVWLHGIGPEVDSIDEALACFFERCPVFLENAEQHEGLDEENVQALRNLFNLMDNYCQSSLGEIDKNEVKRVLGDLKWHEIQDYAKYVYQLFKKTYDN